MAWPFAMSPPEYYGNPLEVAKVEAMVHVLPLLVEVVEDSSGYNDQFHFASRTFADRSRPEWSFSRGSHYCQ
jgi:hypothetical protein